MSRSRGSTSASHAPQSRRRLGLFATVLQLTVGMRLTTLSSFIVRESAKGGGRTIGRKDGASSSAHPDGGIRLVQPADLGIGLWSFEENEVRPGGSVSCSVSCARSCIIHLILFSGTKNAK